MRRILGTVGLISSTVLLAGCLSVDANLNVASDGLVSGELTLEVSQQAAGLLGITSSEAFVEQLQSGQLEGGQATSDLDCEPVERTGALAMTCTFANQEFSDAGELWWVTTDDSSVTFHAQGGEESTEEDTELLGDFLTFGGYTMDVTMPGTITSVSRDFAEQTSDNSVRIEASLTDVFDVTVVSDKGSAGVPFWVWGLVALILAALGVVVALLLVRRRRGSTLLTPEEGMPGPPEIST